MTTNRILCVRRGGLGDTLLMTPVLAALRRRWPGAALDFAGVLEFAAVLKHFGYVDRARSSEDLQLWRLAEAGAMPEALRDYQLVVADDPAVLALCRDGVEVQVFEPRPQRFDRPLGAQLLAQLGLDGAPFAPLLPAPLAKSPDAPIALAPGSGSLQKNWPRASWRQLAERLAAQGHRLLVVVGPTERERDDPTRWPWPAGTSFFVDGSATQLAQLLATSQAFVGNDSGPSHLATLLWLPTVVLYGPGYPAVFAPPGAHVRVLRGTPDAVPDAPVEAVLAALGGLLR